MAKNTIHTNSRSRRANAARRRRAYALYALCGLAICLAAAFGLRALLRPAPDASAPASGQVQAQSETEQVKATQAASEAQAEATPAPTMDLTDVKALPVIYRAKNPGKKVAITVDDCFSPENTRAILNLAEKYEIKLTFFPIGRIVKRDPQLWRDILEKGHEIENHSYHHSNILNMTDEELYNTIVWQNEVMNEVLGVNYHMRYFRPMGGNGTKTKRLHKVLGDLGYAAVASWGLSGNRPAEDTIRLTEAGQILLFHATDTDLSRLKKVIPGLLDKGFKLVTINELYGKEPNLVAPADTPAPSEALKSA